MPKGSIRGFSPEGLNHRVYSDGDIDAIIGGRPTYDSSLSERLEQAAHSFIVLSEFQTKPTAKQIADAMADIEAAAVKLIAALYLPEASGQDPIASMPDALRYGALQAQAALEAEGEELLRDSVRGVYRLHRWARSVQARKQTNPVKKHASDEALDHLFGDLVDIWTDVFHGSIATSVGKPESPNEGQAGGPMIRFFSACLEPILGDSTPSNNAIRARIRRLFPDMAKLSLFWS